MYQYITGKLIEKSPTSVVIDVNGIGYHIHIPVSTYPSLPPTTESVRLLTHLLIREDKHDLFGFYTNEERDLFRLLISVSGIGPKVAMTVLSGIPIIELKRAIIDGALPVLTSISGIGKKTAERLIVELREKIVLEEQPQEALVTATGRPEDSKVEDSVQALVELGYRKQSAKEAVQKALKKPEAFQCSVSDLIRASLKYI